MLTKKLMQTSDRIKEVGLIDTFKSTGKGLLSWVSAFRGSTRKEYEDEIKRAGVQADNTHYICGWDEEEEAFHVKKIG